MEDSHPPRTFHDFSIGKIEFGSRNVIFSLVKGDKEAKISLSGVKVFRSGCLYGGNIIGGVQIYKSISNTRSILPGIFCSIDPSFSEEKDINDVYMKDRELSLFYLEATYGADFACICEDIEVDG